jgi:hypothetical protein
LQLITQASRVLLLVMQLGVKRMLLHSLKELQQKPTFAKAVNLWLRMYLYQNVIPNVLLNLVEVQPVASVLPGAIHVLVLIVLAVAYIIELISRQNWTKSLL